MEAMGAGSQREGWSDTGGADGETAESCVCVCWVGECAVTSQASPFDISVTKMSFERDAELRSVTEGVMIASVSLVCE